VRFQRLDAAGTVTRTRHLRVGDPSACFGNQPGEILRDGTKTVMAGGFGGGTVLLRLDSRLEPDRRFGRRGQLWVATEGTWGLEARIARRRNGYAFGFTAGGEGVPYGWAGHTDLRGRLTGIRRLRRMKGYPSSQVDDVAIDARGRMVVAGALHDENIGIREDYGEPHLAVWRLKAP
jgi:hypothetical protein